jgi:hypothetical protein
LIAHDKLQANQKFSCQNRGEEFAQARRPHSAKFNAK